VKLRDYQERAVSEVRGKFAAGFRRPCLVMPTGSGKTPTAAEIARLALARGNQVLVGAGRIELLDQVVRKLADAGIRDVRVIQGERGETNGVESPITVASVPTLASPRWRGCLPSAALAIVDEAHHIKARTWLETFGGYPNLLALTATPERSDGSPLGDVLDSIVVGVTVSELQARGFLVPCRVYAPPAIMSPRELAMEPVDAYAKHCAGTRCVVFAVTVKHAEKLAAEFRARGIGAEHVSGEMTSRPDIIARHSRGEFPVLVNVALVVEGYDDPALTSAIFARRFTHAGGYLQAIGRLLRPHPGKTEAIVVDLCGSALVHGTPDVDREYSLSGKAISKADRLAIRQCAACGGVSTGRSECPYCSSAFPIAMRGIPKAGDIGVSEVPKTKPTSWPMRAKKVGLCAQCGRQIEAGTWIVYSKLRRIAVHTGCSGAWSQAVAA
jgi:DNA repair protein RadD